MTRDISRLLDSNLTVVIFENDLGAYTAFAVPNDHEDIHIALRDADEDGRLAEGVTLGQSIARLADKAMRVSEKYR